MRIRVTRQHIKDGQACEPDACPIALAIRAVGVKASVGLCDVFLWTGQSWNQVSLPACAARFINDFDVLHRNGDHLGWWKRLWLRRRVRPFSFDLDSE